jgi:hypothetical protein
VSPLYSLKRVRRRTERLLGSVGVPYRGVYSYQEMLAVFGESPGPRGSTLHAFERIAGYITNGSVTGLPPMDEELRTRAKLLLFPESGNGV